MLINFVTFHCGRQAIDPVRVGVCIQNDHLPLTKPTKWIILQINTKMWIFQTDLFVLQKIQNDSESYWLMTLTIWTYRPYFCLFILYVCIIYIWLDIMVVICRHHIPFLLGVIIVIWATYRVGVQFPFKIQD